MKYLKKFNESTGSFYEKISMGEYYSQVKEKESKAFEVSEIDAIKEITGDETPLVFDSSAAYITEIKLDKGLVIIITINKREDDWFYVMIETDLDVRWPELKSSTFCYECDQFDGLIKLLKDYIQK